MPQALISFCEWLADTPFSQLLQNVSWIIPLVQTVHILGIAAVFGAVALLDLRLLNVAARTQTISGMTGRLVPHIWPVLVILLLTGSLLAIAEPVRSLANPAFQLKMLLLLVVISLTVFLQRAVHGDADFWDSTPGRRFGGKLIAVVSLALWLGIIFAGRWIAYMDAASGSI